MADLAPENPVRVEKIEEGAIWHVFLDRPKANVIDSTMVAALQEVFVAAQNEKDLRAICLEGAGPHFSFGASVEEHLPDRVEEMLESFAGLLEKMLETPVPMLAAVRGQCLGGGLEIVSLCERIFAAEDATLGQPEIRLGVFAPFASLILPERLGPAAAADLCLSGRSITAQEAHACGLVDEVAADPTAAAMAYAKKNLLVHSAAALRCATRALRAAFQTRFVNGLAEVIRLYREDLMCTADAEEGIRAFLEKRRPVWRNA